MRDAFGGAFFIKLMLIFFAIYIAFIAIALNYAKAFRVKDSIINYIEENEGYDINVQDLVESYVASMNYYVSSVGPGPEGTSSTSSTTWGNGCTSRGYCVQEMYSDELRGTYFKVTTYLEIVFPFFSIHITVPITGETRVVG